MERNYSNTSMTNYVRLCYVAQYENRKLLVELLQFETSKVDIQPIMAKMQLERSLRNEDKDILLACLKSKNFAILSGRLLNKVLRISNLVHPPANGWYNTPRTCAAINTIGDCVDVINLEYNLIFHSGKIDFTDEEVRDIFLLFKAIARKFEQWLHKDEGEFVSRYENIESCCFDMEMRSRYRRHLHSLERGLKDKNQPRFHPNIYETDSFQLSTEVTNTMRVIYAIQVVLTEELNKYIKSRKSLEELQSETFGKERHRIRQAYGHFSLSFIQKIARNRVIDNNSLSKILNVILTERNNILSEPNASMKKYAEMENSLRVLKKVAKDLEQQMQLPTGKLVVKLEYYETCCMDDQVSNWYHNSLIDLAAKEQQFGTTIPNLQDAGNN